MCFSIQGFAKSTEISNLRVNFMHNPVALDKMPLFSWEIRSSKRAVLQTSYEIFVYEGAKVIWDSGIVKSSETNNIKYTGNDLQSSTTYTWKVEIVINNSEKIKSAEKAFFETGLLNSGWSGAAWIMYDNADDTFEKEKQTDKAMMFRSEFELEKPVKSAKIYTTSIGIHDLFLNGKRVGHQAGNGETVYDELKPGWTDVRNTVFYLTYDVTPYLKKGQNTVGAYVSSGWSSGVIAHDRYKNPALSYKAKLIVEYVGGSQKIIVTNTKNWKSSVNGAIRMADIYAGEDYDARYTNDWTKPNFNTANWHSVLENNTVSAQTTAYIGLPVRVRKDLKTIPQYITIYKDIQKNESDFGSVIPTKQLKKVTSFTLKKGETAVLDFRQNLVGWTPLTLKGQAGTKIKIRYAEMLNDSGSKKRGNDGPKGTLYLKNLRKARASVNYIIGSTMAESYTPSMTWFGFRYAEMTADADVEIKNIYAEVISSVDKEQSAIVTNHPDVNQLFQNTLWGQRGNFISVPLDCPQRNERMGWTGDTQVFANTAMYNQTNLVSFYQKWMGDVRDGQDEDGAFPSIAPQTWGAVGKAESGWANAGVIVPWIVYTMSGNQSVLEENYQAMTRYMNFLSTKSEAEFKYVGGGTKYGDWLAYKETNKRFISVCYYAYDALLMAKIAKALQKTSDADKYDTLYQNIKAEFNKRYVIAKGTLSENTQTAYLYALKLHLFNSKEETEIATSHLVKLLEANNYKLATGFLGTAILNQTLSEIGQSDMAYNLLLQRNNPSWLYSVDQGATTIWERWNSYTIKDGFGDASMNSFNHYAYGVIVEWMYAYMAGIKTEDAGFRNIIIEPQLDLRKTFPQGQKQITEVKGEYASVNGMIKSHWKIKGNQVEYNISVPANTMAQFIVQNTMKNIPKEGDGIQSISQKDNKTVIGLGSGEYEFKMNLK